MRFLPLLSGLGLILCAVYAGAMQMSYWTIPLLALIFIAAHVGERWPAWQQINGEGTGVFLRMLYRVFSLQFLLVGIFYFVPFLIASLAGDGMSFSRFGATEARLLGVAALFGVLTAMFASPAAPESGGEPESPGEDQPS